MNDLVSVATDFVLRDRTDYQLLHFVIGQHDTPEMQYKQIILEARDLFLRIKNAEIQLQIDEEKIKKLRNKDSKIKNLKADRIELHMRATMSLLEAAKQELAYLVTLWQQYPKFTHEDIENNQMDYWALRLTRQAMTDRMALDQGVDKGNVASMINAGLVSAELTR
jgi:hypothetical protein